MWSISIVKMNYLLNCQVYLSEIHEAGVETIFGFQYADETFCKNVVITISNGSHTWLNMTGEQGVHVGMARILNAMIRVVNQVTLSNLRQMRQSHMQAIQCPICSQRSSHMPAQDITCKQIHQDKQVGKRPISISSISDITNPNLVWVRDRHANEPVWNSPQTRNSRATVGFSAFDQQIFFGEATRTGDPAQFAAGQSAERLDFAYGSAASLRGCFRLT